MEILKILSKVDHTLLSPDTTWESIRILCDEAVQYSAASVCIPPSYVKPAAKYLNGKIAVCTVVGFPNGYSNSLAKKTETLLAISDGAAEIDMVINIGFLKDKRYSEVSEEIASLKRICGDRILKVIVETCLLKEAEKIIMCELVTTAQADYIKTSTGFSHAGATAADIELFARHIGPNVKIKAAGGIKTFEDAKMLLKHGADRLGTSGLIKLAKTMLPK